MSGIAEVHPDATLTPTKLDLVAEWLPLQPWFSGDPATARLVGAFRFVDPDGEVGIETLLVRVGDTTHHVPLTYRSEPLEGADEFLVGTMEHSLLGQRWVYDATGDPVYNVELVRVIREGDTEADRSAGEKTAWAEGSGVVPGVDLAGHLRVVRAIDADPHFTTEHARGLLVGRWKDDGDHETVLACLR